MPFELFILCESPVTQFISWAPSSFFLRHLADFQGICSEAKFYTSPSPCKRTCLFVSERDEESVWGECVEGDLATRYKYFEWRKRLLWVSSDLLTCFLWGFITNAEIENWEFSGRFPHFSFFNSLRLCSGCGTWFLFICVLLYLYIHKEWRPMAFVKRASGAAPKPSASHRFKAENLYDSAAALPNLFHHRRNQDGLKNRFGRAPAVVFSFFLSFLLTIHNRLLRKPLLLKRTCSVRLLQINSSLCVFWPPYRFCNPASPPFFSWLHSTPAINSPSILSGSRGPCLHSTSPQIPPSNCDCWCRASGNSVFPLGPVISFNFFAYDCHRFPLICCYWRGRLKSFFTFQSKSVKTSNVNWILTPPTVDVWSPAADNALCFLPSLLCMRSCW